MNWQHNFLLIYSNNFFLLFALLFVYGSFSIQSWKIVYLLESSLHVNSVESSCGFVIIAPVPASNFYYICLITLQYINDQIFGGRDHLSLELPNVTKSISNHNFWHFCNANIFCTSCLVWTTYFLSLKQSKEMTERSLKDCIKILQFSFLSNSNLSFLKTWFYL